ncbi:MAG TPA: hypothetical protein VFQ36_17635 [Ktedonobacteraceae bacterium]|nr:hypothetical protein [Ktedonobacteraceae bacterium]
MIWIVLNDLAVSNSRQHFSQRDRFFFHFFTSMIGYTYSPFGSLRSYAGKYNIHAHLLIPHCMFSVVSQLHSIITGQAYLAAIKGTAILLEL